MDPRRRQILATAAGIPGLVWFNGWADNSSMAAENLILSSFEDGQAKLPAGGGWRGFSDRVMGGISNAEFVQAEIAGKDSLHLTGNVTRESNGGFIQMAYYFGNNNASFDASAYRGVAMLVYGNNEEYNVHLRTKDCRWYDESYRFTFFAKDEWQRVQVPWDSFKGNGVATPLDSSTLQRIAILGWMREFDADIALAELSLYV